MDNYFKVYIIFITWLKRQKIYAFSLLSRFYFLQVILPDFLRFIKQAFILFFL